MKLRHVLGLAATLSLSFLAPAYATETLYVPASSATMAPTDPGNICYVQTGIGFSASTQFDFCQVDFPLTLSVGHTIKQIAVVHSDTNVFSNPYITAYLMVNESAAPYDTYSQFIWESFDSLPFPVTQTSRLMAQSGKLYPDAFVVQMGLIYHVIVRLEQGTVVHGLQLTYE